MYDSKHQNILDTALQLLQKEVPDLVAVFVFGSFGTEYERNDSDLDLAILTRSLHSVDTVKLWYLAQEIARNVKQDVEIADLREASTVFAFEILSSGNCIFCSDEPFLANFDTLAISMYLRFQEERKEILQDYESGAL